MDNLIFSPMTFGQDHLARDCRGSVIGRLVLVDDKGFELGKDLKVALFKIPKVFDLSPLGLVVFIDGKKYQVPETLVGFRVNRRKEDIIISSFVLKCIE